MKKTVLFFLTILFFVQCASVKKHNAHLNTLISAEKLNLMLISYQQLQTSSKFYWYIAKELDYKFDSLKSSISKTEPFLNFYKKLSCNGCCCSRRSPISYLPPNHLQRNKSRPLLKRNRSLFPI
jgi:hypothetical protein